MTRKIAGSLGESENAVSVRIHRGLKKMRGALQEDEPEAAPKPKRRAVDSANDALHDEEAYGSVVNLVRKARRTASSMRERLSADFWALLLDLENRLANGARNVPICPST